MGHMERRGDEKIDSVQNLHYNSLYKHLDTYETL